MRQETRQCQNCGNEFKIEAEDFSFYEKIKVPAPTFCPKCRLERRMAFRNILHLYKRRCDFCQEEKIAILPPEAPYRAYCSLCWWSDAWDPLEYGRDYDFSKSFFAQFEELLHEAPILALSVDQETAKSSPYNSDAGHLKNCYLLFHGNYSEDSAYGFVVVRGNKSVFDCSLTGESAFCFDSLNCFKNNRCVSVKNTTNSLESAFLRDSVNCQNCFASANLRSKKYYIFNKPYTKEEYKSEIKKWDLGSYKTYQEVKKLAEAHWKKFPAKPRWDEFSTNVTGNYVFSSKNCKECYEVSGAQDSKYLFLCPTPTISDCYDIFEWGDNLSLSYECETVGEQATGVRFSSELGLNISDVEYSKLSTSGSHHFGCVSVRKADYCILNKRYSKEDYFTLREKIIKHMGEMPYIAKIRNTKSETRNIEYKYGEFFPPELSPFGYNTTFAHSFFPMEKAEALARGLKWQDEETKSVHAITKKASELPDHIKDATDGILDEVIGCEKCGKGFKMIKMELEFLRAMNLPLPRRCPFCRINEKFATWINQMKLVSRECSKCGAKFETPFTKEDYPQMLCSKCYQAEVV